MPCHSQFTHAEGSALYRVHSAMNHSCEPNAECRYRRAPGPAPATAVPCRSDWFSPPSNRFTESNAVVNVVATRPIRAGEEILLCYLDDAEHMPVSVR